MILSVTYSGYRVAAMDFLTVCGFGVVAVVLCVVVRQIKPDSALAISVVAGIFILAAVVTAIAPSISAITELSQKAGINDEFVKILLKALAVCYITTLCADCACDAGESALGVKLELVGRAAIVAISLPVFTSLADFVTGMLS